MSAGIANAGTGPDGVADAERLASLAAAELGAADEEVLVCATGLIGGRIPVDEILPGISEVAERISIDGGEDAASAIMTTDTRPKTAARSLEVGGTRLSVGGMAKGAGMIEPHMRVAHATMLAFLTTDAAVPPDRLREVLADCLDDTFNAITVDGAMSTNDTVLLFANGAAGVDASGEAAFADAVREVMADLAYAIVADGEGATKVVRCRVAGAASHADAQRAVREMANSILLRSALWGGDPNWGRVLGALGQAPIELDPERVRIAIGGVDLAVAGVGTGREQEAAERFGTPEILVEADLGLGSAVAEMLTCDLSPEYVRLNADYTT